MKRISTIIAALLLTTVMAWGQSGMTDDQVMDYVIEQNSKGVSRQHIITQLMQRGVTIDQIRRIQRKYQKQTNGEALGADDITAGTKAAKNRLRQANGDQRDEEKASKKASQ